MATLYITELSSLASVSGIQVAKLPALAEQTVTVGAEADSSAFNSSTRFIRVYTDTACHITVGLTPTATTAMLALPAGAIEYFGVTPGQKLSVIAT